MSTCGQCAHFHYKPRLFSSQYDGECDAPAPIYASPIGGKDRNAMWRAFPAERCRCFQDKVHVRAARTGESFAHTACAFLADWKAGRLTAQEVCSTLWAAAVARGLNKEPG